MRLTHTSRGWAAGVIVASSVACSGTEPAPGIATNDFLVDTLATAETVALYRFLESSITRDLVVVGSREPYRGRVCSALADDRAASA